MWGLLKGFFPVRRDSVFILTAFLGLALKPASWPVFFVSQLWCKDGFHETWLGKPTEITLTMSPRTVSFQLEKKPNLSLLFQFAFVLFTFPFLHQGLACISGQPETMPSRLPSNSCSCCLSFQSAEIINQGHCTWHGLGFWSISRLQTSKSRLGLA